MSHPRSGSAAPSTRRLATRLTTLLAALLTTGCATFSGRGQPTLDDAIEAIVSAPPLDQVNWGIMVLDPARDRVVYARNAHRKFVPASNMKVLSTSTALSLLGPDFRLETSLWQVGEVDGPTGRLTGDLVLHPSGDPTFSETFYPRAEAPFDSLAEAVYRAGVRSVSGTLVVEASAWDSTTVPGSWMVGNLAGTSGATGSALAIANGEMALEVRAGDGEGAPAQTRWWPATPDDFFSASFVTASSDSSFQREIHYLPESQRLKVEGRIPMGAVDTVFLAQRAPAPLAAHALLRALETRGIHVEGGLRIIWEAGQPLGMAECVSGRPPRGEGLDAVSRAVDSPPDSAGSSATGIPRERLLPECPDARKIAEIHSPPLREIVQAILEPSQNWMTEQLVHILGLEMGEEGSWQEGFRVEEEFLTGTVGVDSLDLHFRDGSGLSAYNLVTPRAMVRILEFMKKGPNGQLYQHALAEPGEDGSTLRSRLEGLEGRVFGKTGTISHVNSLSGYLVTRSGRELIFSILTNGSGLPSGVVRAGIDDVVRAIAGR
jgi:D-alanyl-D-alanine carboxypeptidase/D-alanyl-D-alanine-endopeptidase (penicillin-binding protein 4)